MANEPTQETETIETPPISVTAVRDALLAILPKDSNIVSDVKIHDGLADVLIRWRSLKWANICAMQDASPEQIAETIDSGFREWLRNTLKNMADIPKHARILAEMKDWLRKSPDAREWLYHANKTDLAA